MGRKEEPVKRKELAEGGRWGRPISKEEVTRLRAQIYKSNNWAQTRREGEGKSMIRREGKGKGEGGPKVMCHRREGGGGKLMSTTLSQHPMAQPSGCLCFRPLK